MSEEYEQADTRPPPRLRASPVWLVPLAAVLIGAWLIYQNVSTRGPLIYLTMPNAESIEAGKTVVKLRNVEVGKVRKVRLSDDFKRTVAEIRMEPEVEPLLNQDTGFWVVKPRVGRQGISGLSTIISGAYIQMRLGESEQPAYRFEVLEHAPAMRGDIPGVTLTLVSGEDYSLAIGDPVIYQGQNVGQVETAEFIATSQHTRHQIFVEAPYDDLITQDTQFWLRSGVDFQWTPAGFEVQLGNLQSILAGGVAFAARESEGEEIQAADGDVFKLYRSREAASQERFDLRLEFLALFDETVKYLYPDAPVEFRGIRVGTVTQVPFFGNGLEPPRLEDARVPILISFEPQRVGGSWSELTEDEWRARLEEQFGKGLRATLETSNILTGALYVSLDFQDDAPPQRREAIAGYPVFPTAPGSFAGIESRVTKLLDKLNNLELNPVLNEIRSTLVTTQSLMSTTQSSISKLNGTLEASGAENLPRQLDKTLAELQRTLNSYQQGQPAYDNLQRSLDRLNRLLEDLGPAARTLNEQPNAIIFGKDREADPQPRAPE